MSSDTIAPLACDPGSISPDRRERWVAVVKDLYRSVEEVKELPEGYALRLPTRDDILALAAEEISYERLCCPFMVYTLEVEANHGPSWLRMTGTGVKEFLRLGLESGDLLDPEVANAAGLDTARATPLRSVEATLNTIAEVNARFARRT